MSGGVNGIGAGGPAGSIGPSRPSGADGVGPIDGPSFAARMAAHGSALEAQRGAEARPASALDSIGGALRQSRSEGLDQSATAERVVRAELERCLGTEATPEIVAAVHEAVMAQAPLLERISGLGRML